MGIAWNSLLSFPALLEAGSAAVDLTKINSVAHQRRFGRAWVVKCRNGPGKPITSLANLYFRVGGIRIRYWSDARAWQRWEIGCFRMLNGDRFRAFAVGEQALCAAKLPGRSLMDHLKQRTLSRRMLDAAGRELRRAHGFWSEHFGGPWSHGDAGTSNVIYDAMTDRARLIDFEIVHEKTMSASARHADDLCVFLLDLMALGPRQEWLGWAMAFLEAYAPSEEVLAELRRRLVLPTGMARIWWNVRTSWASTRRMTKRVGALRRALEEAKKGAGEHAVAA